MDWRDAKRYVFEPSLTKEEWAWQFLRRNGEYRSDYAWFIGTWRALESDYGAPPHRDFYRWRQDPRAWRRESEIAGCDVERCPGEGGQVLIECWMGAKWGLRKFPVDPATERPVLGEELAWRERPVHVEEAVSSEDLSSGETRMALAFDLALPLAVQIQDARMRLAARRHALEKAGRLPPRRVRSAAGIWLAWLRVLDGLADGAGEPELAAVLGLRDIASAVTAARRMSADGYRDILLMEA
jgi:hypothetical protein